MTHRLSGVRWSVFALIVALAVINYRFMFAYTTLMFSEPLEDMSHGWLVPLVSLYVLWRQRQELREAVGLPCWRGVIWVLPFLVLAWFGGRGGQSRLEQLSFIGLVWAVPYALWGVGVGRLMQFPALYLVFTIPVSSFVDFFTIHLRIFSSTMATLLLNGVGLAVEQSGTALFSRVPGSFFNVDVADPCSGIRSLFAMMALTAAYAYFRQKGFWSKWLLFACSLPIAMIGNMIRIMSICLIAYWFGQEVATGYYHDYSAYVVFLVGVLLMVQASEWIARLAKRFERQGDVASVAFEGGAEVACGGDNGSGIRIFGPMGLVCVLVAGVFIANRMVPPPTYDHTLFVTDSLPVKVGDLTSSVPLFCHNPQCLAVVTQREEKGQVCPDCGEMLYKISLGEMTDLPKDTIIIKRTYRAMDGAVYAVSMVIGGHNRNSIHRAELCLPAQGYTMLEAERLILNLKGHGPLKVRRIQAQRSGERTLSLVYWFLSRDHESCSHTERILLDVWDRSMHNRINRWVMVAVNISSGLETTEQKAAFEAFISELYPMICVVR